MRSTTRLLTTVLALLAFHPAGAVSTRGHAVNDLKLPDTTAEANSYAIDLDGDGTPQNQFGNALYALAFAFELDVAGNTSAAVASGQVVHLVELRSTDATFTNDTAAEATWHVGVAAPAPPLFDGSDTFRYDPDFLNGTFVAPLVSHAFVSAIPATSSEPAYVFVRIRIESQTFLLQLQGGRLKFTTTPTGLVLGQGNGSISKEDIDNVFVPTLADAFNEVIQADPQSDRAMSLLQTFDNNPMNGTISVAEVVADSLIETILRPDVDIRDENGNYAPNPTNPEKDALSFGFGFTAVTSVTILPRIFEDGFE